jgi:hypothetical protein
MKKIRSVLSRYRLITSVLALALALGALWFTPAAVANDEEGGGAWQCSTGCVNWDARVGCLQYLTCCVSDRTGNWNCILN